MQNQIIAPHIDHDDIDQWLAALEAEGEVLVEIQKWEDYRDEVRNDLRIMRNLEKDAARENWRGYNRRFILDEIAYLQSKVAESNQKIAELNN